MSYRKEGNQCRGDEPGNIPAEHGISPRYLTAGYVYYAARRAKKVFGLISGELDMPNEEVHFCRPHLSRQTSNSNVNI